MPDAASVGETADDARGLAGFVYLLERRTGLLLDERRQDALHAAVVSVARRFGLAGAGEVLRACREGGDDEVFGAMVAELTVGETHFFRNRPHFDALQDVVLPELLERARTRGRLAIWSAGCSTGEEPYSLAMALAKTASRSGVDLSAIKLSIVGTDIDQAALDVAATGEYGRYSFRSVRESEIEAFFEELPDERRRVKQRYRDMVSFRRLNLKTDPYPHPDTFHDVDLIVCRNVTIYFSPDTVRHVADGFHDTLSDGGYLLVGHSEHSLETYRRFQARALPDVILYQRGGDRRQAAPDELRELLHATPHALRAPVSRAPAPAVEALHEPAEAAPVALPATLEAARDALSEGDFNRAVILAVEVLEQSPTDAGACLLLGEMAADRGHVAEAEIWLRKAVDLRPLDLGAHYLLALLALERGDRRSALQCLERALYVDPEFVLAHFLRSRLERDAGQREASLRSCRTARALLAVRADAQPVPYSQGLTVGQLREMLEAVAS